MRKQYDSMGQRIHVGDVLTHFTGSGHAMSVCVGVVTKLSGSGIHATVTYTLRHGERTTPQRGLATLRKAYFRDGRYCTVTNLGYEELEARLGVKLPISIDPITGNMLVVA